MTSVTQRPDVVANVAEYERIWAEECSIIGEWERREGFGDRVVSTHEEFARIEVIQKRRDVIAGMLAIALIQAVVDERPQTSAESQAPLSIRELSEEEKDENCIDDHCEFCGEPESECICED